MEVITTTRKLKSEISRLNKKGNKKARNKVSNGGIQNG